MIKKSLKQLYKTHQGKVTDKWSMYLNDYDRIFETYRDKPIRLLEIGIQNGGSLDIWVKYFPNAQHLVGCDINPDSIKLNYDDPRITLVVGDANSYEARNSISSIVAEFDIIIDDGSHRSSDIVKSFSCYWPLLSDNGVFIAEDLHCSYWQDYEGGLFAPYSSMAFFKNLADVINYEHWGISGSRSLLMKDFEKRYGFQLSEDLYQHIHSIEFINSVCIIRKKTPFENILGSRIVVGTDEVVIPGQKQRSLNAKKHFPNEAANEWSKHDEPHGAEFAYIYRQYQIQGFTVVETRNSQNASDKIIRQLQNEAAASTFQLKILQKHAAQVEFELNTRLNDQQLVVDSLHSHVARLHELNEAFILSTSWRFTSSFRFISSWMSRQLNRFKIVSFALMPAGSAERKRVSKAVSRRLSAVSEPIVQDVQYQQWFDEFVHLQMRDEALIKQHISQVALPSIEIYWQLSAQIDQAGIDSLMSSLMSQLLTEWHINFLLPVNMAKNVKKYIFDIKNSNSKVRVLEARKAVDVTLGLNLNTPILLIEGEGQLASNALYLFALVAATGKEFAYADEDVINKMGHHTPLFKPQYSPEFSKQINYFGNFGLISTSNSEIVLEMKRFISQKSDLTNVFKYLANLQANKVTHIPFVLFHSLKKQKVEQPSQNLEQIIKNISVPSVAIIIPTKNRLDLLQPCLESILNKTLYPRENYTITVVDNGSSDADVIEYMEKLVRDNDIQLLKAPEKFNYSRLNNKAVIASESEILVFLNNDIVVDDPYWLQRLVEQAVKVDVGAVGAKLLYPDRTVQHGGVVLGIQGVAAHAHHNLNENAGGYMGLSNVTHEVSAVTGACLAMRRSVFNEVGGFDENLAVAFNDVVLCLSILSKGYRNIYIGKPLLIHYESKTRGFDDTEEKIKLFKEEAIYARKKFNILFNDDPYYNSNLSLDKIYALAYPPRAVKPWLYFKSNSNSQKRILMLSITNQIGHGVAVVVDIQARYLAQQGYQVFVGGPIAENEFEYEGCQRVDLPDANAAANYAYKNNIDCVIMHTPPFYSCSRWLGNAMIKIAYDYGEPPPDLFPDHTARKNQISEKNFTISLADKIYAISDAVKAESPHQEMGVLPLGNSHLSIWDSTCVWRRIQTRQKFHLDGRIVILNVCRFHKAERHYKGIDIYAAVCAELALNSSELSERFAFIMAGKANLDDVLEMQQAGLLVFPNISDEELIDLYCAADVYANFSMWEGYNLGIGQALAMGLPVIASDIPAHRAFGISVSNNVSEIVSKLLDVASKINNNSRVAKVINWDIHLAQLEHIIEDAFSRRLIAQ